MNPPRVVEVTNPSSQRTTKMSAMVQSIVAPASGVPPATHAGTYQNQTTTNRDPADPSGNLSLRPLGLRLAARMPRAATTSAAISSTVFWLRPMMIAGELT